METVILKGNPLEAARNAAGYSVRGLAKASGVGATTIFEIERGRVPTPSVALSIAAALHPGRPFDEPRPMADRLRGEVEAWAKQQEDEGSGDE